MAAMQTSLVILFFLAQPCVEAAVIKRGQPAFMSANKTTPHISFAQMLTNNTVVNRMRHEIEHELHMKGDEPVKNKVIFIALSLFVGAFGCDRCYMGQFVLGTLKFITGGCCGIWLFVDYFIAAYSGLTMAREINMMLYSAKFEEGTVESAYWVTVIVLCLQWGGVVLSCLMYSCIACLALGMAGASMAADAQTHQDNIDAKVATAKNKTKAKMPAPVARVFRNYGLIHSKPSPEEIDGLFAEIDADGNGYIEQGELTEALTKRGFTEEDSKEMMDKADTSKDGKISKEELKAYLAEAVEDKTPKDEPKEEAKEEVKEEVKA